MTRAQQIHRASMMLVEMAARGVDIKDLAMETYSGGAFGSDDYVRRIYNKVNLASIKFHKG